MYKILRRFVYERICRFNKGKLDIVLNEMYSYDAEAATSSVFIQQREKILLEAHEFLFHRFTSSSVNPNFYDDYQMLAVDGSNLCIPHNIKELGRIIKLVKGPYTEYDSEAIRAELPFVDKIEYVANSVYTVVKGTFSLG